MGGADTFRTTGAQFDALAAQLARLETKIDRLISALTIPVTDATVVGAAPHKLTTGKELVVTTKK